MGDRSPLYPVEFEHSVDARLGDEATAFWSSMSDTPPTAIQLNKKKPSDVFPDAIPTPWCPFGRLLQNRPNFTHEPDFHAGAYYVMEPASMHIWEALKTAFGDDRNIVALDLCAAPGGKSSVILNFIEDGGFLVSNEIHPRRYGTLLENVRKTGAVNVYITNSETARIATGAIFDCILVDAPCSGEGLFRKTPQARGEWSQRNVELCAMRQKSILTDALPLLKPGGFLIYSTCTFNSSENMQNVEWLVKNQAMESLKLNLIFDLEHIEKGEVHGYQSWPHLSAGEGFFMALLRKRDTEPADQGKKLTTASLRLANKDEEALWLPFLDQGQLWIIAADRKDRFYAIPSDRWEFVRDLNTSIPSGQPVLQLGELKGNDPVPSHVLALSTALNPSLPGIPADRATGIRYLKRENLGRSELQTKWTVVRHNRLALGWAKIVGGKVKNYLPIAMRIRG